jgi:hypothetical protein
MICRVMDFVLPSRVMDSPAFGGIMVCILKGNPDAFFKPQHAPRLKQGKKPLDPQGQQIS